MTAREIMVMGDPHAHPRLDNDRFELMGRLAQHRGVDHVHCVGDWTDFPSLNMHKSRAEQRPDNYRADVEAGNDALERFDDGLRGWTPRLTITLGNHDVYPSRWASENPQFQGTISPGDIMFEEHGWEVFPFDEPHKVGGLWAAHYFPSSPSSSRPQGGQHVAHHNLAKQCHTCVFGHNHRFNHALKTLGDGSKIHAWSAGTTGHTAYIEGWCRQTRKYWDHGLLFIGLDDDQVRGHTWITWEQVERLTKR